jgi:GNAT superfamily N-acetyltransferase
MIQIRNYTPADEVGWLRCRAIAYLDTAYHDDVKTAKPVYENPAMELVAEAGGRIVGLIDLELEPEPGALCSERPGPRAMIWDITVHPDFRRQGIGRLFLDHALAWAREREVAFIEAWTRDDPWVRNWYDSHGFRSFRTYWHVFLDHERARTTLESRVAQLKPVSVFAHYLGENLEEIRERIVRSHECCGYELPVSREVSSEQPEAPATSGHHST